MGGGTYDPDAAKATYSASVASGSVFATSASTMSKPRAMRTPHATLNPKTTNKAGAHIDTSIREALDSDEHPESTPIAIFFDVTGSMQGVPRVLVEKFPDLFGLLLRKGYVTDPQIAIGAIGDGYSDSVPFQIGQFESDTRIDEALNNIVLEGGGGGGNHESYELGFWWLANRTYIDSWEKRGKRGHAFFIGDERLYRKVRQNQVAEYLGGGLQEDADTIDVAAAAMEKWDCHFIFPAEGSYSMESIVPATVSDSTALGWAEVITEPIILDDANAVCETIALAIGLAEGTIDLDTGLDDLAAAGATPKVLASVGSALATASGGGGSVAVADGDTLGGLSAEGVDRL